MLLGTRELPVEELIAAVLRRVLVEVVRVTEGTAPPVVLTYPAGWGPFGVPRWWPPRGEPG